ncbi:MAG: hydroxyisourate hydrolase [Benniella sp.]|nr:MAG: hydroxyisourate hydrolase [Benniella sp.]
MATQRSPITCHVLDSSCGKPGNNVPVKLEMLNVSAWDSVAYGLTDSDGRVSTLLNPSHQLTAGIYRMTFQTAEYWASRGVTGYFYPYVQIIFEVAAGAEKQHYHIPLLLSPYSYTTYRGS